MIERHLNIIKEAAKWQNIATFNKEKVELSPEMLDINETPESVETVPEEDTLLEHDGEKVGFMNRKNIADGWFETAPKGRLTNTPFKFYPPTSGKSVLMTYFQVEDLVKDLTKALEARKGKGSGESWATRMLAGPSDSWQ